MKEEEVQKTCKHKEPEFNACNPSNSKGKHQEDQGSKPARANSSQDPIPKVPNTKKGLAE
jgi:hypothetical protein